MFAPTTVEKVLCHLLRFGSSRADAEDLAQEALLIAWRERASLDSNRSLDGWLYGIARNVYRNHTRRQRRSPVDTVDEVDAVQSSPPIGDVLALQRALQALPENQQDIVILHELEGHTLKETAELLAIPFDTAKDRLKRARATLETACNVDAAVRAEQPATRRVAKAAVASVIAGLLGAIAKEGTAVAAGFSKATVIAALAGGLVVGGAAGIVIDRAMTSHTQPAPLREPLATSHTQPAPSREPVATPDAPLALDAPADASTDAPADTPPPPDAAVAVIDVGAETALIDRAHAALRASLPRDAVRALDAHARRFPRGQLAEERDLLAIEAYIALGDTPAARQRIARFRVAYPASLHADRVTALEHQLPP